MIEKYTDPQYTQVPYAVPIPKKESWERGYADGRASIVEELEKIKAEILEQKDIFDKKNQFQYKVGLSYAYDIIENHIEKLKGENNE